MPRKKELNHADQLRELSKLDALNFLEEMRTLNQKIDGVKKPISIRIPENLLKVLKLKAKLENRKYQNLIVESIREFLAKEL